MPDPNRHELAAMDESFATARRLYAAMNATEHESVAQILREVAESDRGAAVLLSAIELGLEFARSCESDGLLADESGVLTLQVFLDSAALNQITRSASTRRIADEDTHAENTDTDDDDGA